MPVLVCIHEIHLYSAAQAILHLFVSIVLTISTNAIKGKAIRAKGSTLSPLEHRDREDLADAIAI